MVGKEIGRNSIYSMERSRPYGDRYKNRRGVNVYKQDLEFIKTHIVDRDELITPDEEAAHEQAVNGSV